MRKDSKPFLIGHGGNAAHLPNHTAESCLSAYTAGADGLYITVQETSDGVLLLYEYDDLSAQTNKTGVIADQDAASLLSIPEQANQSGTVGADAGATFSLGQDKPWRENWGKHRFPRLCVMDALLRRLEDNVVYFIKPGTAKAAPDKRIKLALRILSIFEAAGLVAPVVVFESPELLNSFRTATSKAVDLALDATGGDLDEHAIELAKPRFVFASGGLYKSLSSQQSTAPEVTLIRALALTEVASVDDQIILTRDVSAVREQCGLWATTMTETWPGTKIDTSRWIAGVSSGHHIMLPMLGVGEYLEPVFPASASANNGLNINVVESYTYASAGVVSCFSVGNCFALDMDFTYDNPQVANMMVLAVINQEVWEQYYHQEGVWKNPNAMFQNHVFDTHGAAPFVSMEREEADGFRLMKYTSTAGVYEWYGNYYLCDVGNGQSKKGKLRLERRGRFFSGYYQDENNSDWIGVGTTENASMNDRIYIRIGAKHYPKSGMPQPLASLNVSCSNLRVQRPVGPQYQREISALPASRLRADVG